MAHKGKRSVVKSARSLSRVARFFQHLFSLVAHQKKAHIPKETRAAKAIFLGDGALFFFFILPYRRTNSKISMAKKALSAAFIEEMRTLLVNEITRLEKELASFSHRDPSKAEEEMSDAGADEGESAERIAQLGDNLSLEEELTKALKDAQSAIKALDKGEYGMCKYCKQPIDEARLRIRPTSTSCVACKRTLTQEM